MECSGGTEPIVEDCPDQIDKLTETTRWKSSRNGACYTDNKGSDEDGACCKDDECKCVETNSANAVCSSTCACNDVPRKKKETRLDAKVQLLDPRWELKFGMDDSVTGTVHATRNGNPPIEDFSTQMKATAGAGY